MVLLKIFYTTLLKTQQNSFQTFLATKSLKCILLACKLASS